MTDHTHDELRSLLGAYTLGAVSALENRRVSRHLEQCADCAREVRLLSQVSSELSTVAGEDDMPAEFVESIMDSLPQPRRIGHSRLVRVAAGFAAAALIAIAGLSTVYVRERTRADDLAGRLRAVEQVIASADSSARLSGVGDFEGRGSMYVDAESRRAVLVLEEMPALGSARSYQVWALGAGDPISIDVIEAHGTITRVLDDIPSANQFAITVEPSGGSPQPTTNPVLVGA